MVLFTNQSIISSAPSAFSAAFFAVLAVVPSRTILAVLPTFPSFAPLSVSPLPAFGSLFLSPFPGLLGEEVALDGEGGMIAGVLPLLGSGVSGERDFEDGEESFLADSDESLLSGFIYINNFLFGDVDDLVQSLDLASHYFCDPEGLVHELLSGLDGDEGFALAEEEGECAGDVAAWVGEVVP